MQQEQADQLHPKNFGMLEGSNYTFENWDDGGGRKWDKYFTILVYIASQASKLGVNFFQTYGKMARELSKQWPRSRTSRTESKILGRGQNSSDEICLQVVNSHHPLSSPSLYWIKISILIWQDQSGCIVQDHKFIPLPPTGHSYTQQQQNSIYSALLIQYGRRRRNPSKIFFQYSLLFCDDHTVLVTQNKLSFAAAVCCCAQLAAMGWIRVCLSAITL